MMAYNSRINMPAKKSQKRKKSINSAVMQNSLVGGSAMFTVGTNAPATQGGLIHQTINIKPNLKEIYASASVSGAKARHSNH